MFVPFLGYHWEVRFDAKSPTQGQVGHSGKSTFMTCAGIHFLKTQAGGFPNI